MTKSKRKNRKRRFRIIRFILIILVLLIGFLFFDSYFRIVTTEYELRHKNLPASFDGFRIVVLSDIHAAEFGKDNERLLRLVRDAKPDIIAIIGDFTDKYYKKVTLERQLEIAESLTKNLLIIAPVYYVTGNHEWDSDGLWPLLSMLEENGVRILRNKYSSLESGKDTIILAGTEDPNGPADMIKPKEFIGNIFNAEGDCFIVLLEHRNRNPELYSELGVDVVLCGHAHGGMIRLPFTDGLIGPAMDWLPEYTNGLYTIGETSMVVSRGIGNHTGWPRFLNNPHIPVVILRKG